MGDVGNRKDAHGVTPWESWIKGGRRIPTATRRGRLPLIRALLCAALTFAACESARAGELATLTEENFSALAPRGDEAEAILGDYVLQNDRIILVIDNPELPGGYASNRALAMRTGGSILDMTTRAKEGKSPWASPDRLGWFFTSSIWQSRDYAGRAQYDPHYARDFKPQKDKTLNLEFDHSWHIDQPPVRVKYTLEDGQPFVRCETIYLNPAAQKKVDPKKNEAKSDDDKFADAAAPNLPDAPKAAEKVHAPLVPSPMFELCIDGVIERGTDPSQNLSWFYDAWNGQAFGVVDEKTWTHRLANGKERAVDPKTVVMLQQNEELHAVRRVFVATDLFELRRNVDEFLAAKNRPVKLRVEAPDGAVAGAHVTARRMVDGEAKTYYGGGRTNASGKIEFTLPDGDFELRIEAVGRATQTQIVKADSPRDLAVKTTAPAWIKFEVTDEAGAPIPCKVELRGRDGTPDPYFFPETGGREVRNLLYLADGKATQIVSPGKYEVILTRGAEYDAVTEQVELAVSDQAGAKTVRAKLVRSVDTAGWISAEFSGRSTMSNHPWDQKPATGTVLGRVLNLLCEGVEFAPAFEYCRIATYQPTVEQLGAKRFLAACPGTDLADGNRSHLGFPIVYEHPHWLDGGALQMPLHVDPLSWLRHWGAPPDNPDKPWMTAGVHGYEKCIILSQVRNTPVKPPDEVRIPHSSHGDYDLSTPNGEPMGRHYFMRDTDDDGVPDRVNFALALLMDALDVHSLDGLLGPGPRVPNDVVDWLLMRANGYRMPGVVGSGAIDNFHGAGGVRTYVRSGADAPDKIDALSIAREVRAGHAVMTTGPFLEATLTTAEKTTGIPGDSVTTKSDAASLHVRVQCPNWITIDRVECWINGRVEPTLSFDRAKAPTKFGEGRVQFDQTLTLPTRSDTQVIVLAYGHGPNYRRRTGPTDTVARHVAVTNPILVDVGGDGFAPMNPVEEAIKIEPVLLSPVLSKKGSPPGRMKLTIQNEGKTAAEGVAKIELRPADVVAIDGKSEIPFKLGAGEKVEVEVKLRVAGDAELEALMGAGEQKKMTTSFYVVRSKNPPGIAPSKLKITVDDAAKMLDVDGVR